jgi:hypothetical protein
LSGREFGRIKGTTAAATLKVLREITGSGEGADYVVRYGGGHGFKDNPRKTVAAPTRHNRNYSLGRAHATKF